VFLSFHTDDELIVDSLIGGLSTCFETAQEFEFTTQRTAPINQLIYDTPKQIVDQAKLDANRRERLESADKVSENQAQEIKANKGLVASEFHVTITAIGILGHVLRNHYARIDAEPKKRIFNATTNAALRSLEICLTNCPSRSLILCRPSRRFRTN